MQQCDEYEDFEFGVLSEQEIRLIKEEYSRQKLKESLIGPIISTFVHSCLIVLAVLFFQGEAVSKNAHVEITKMEEAPPVDVPPPPPPPPEIPPPEPQDVVSLDPSFISEDALDTEDLLVETEEISDAPPSSIDSEFDLTTDIKPSTSSLLSSNMFGGRSASGRTAAIKSYGGKMAAQESLTKALEWLADVQNPNGSWCSADSNSRSYTAMTSLALLTYLAHGETPKSKKYGKTVSKAIAWLIKDPITSDSYSHAIKTYALAEAYAMTGNYALKELVENCVKVIVDGQQDAGGFTYNYGPASVKEDLSVGGWNYQAMKAAKASGCGASELSNAVDLSLHYLKKMAGGSSSGDGFPYDYNKKKTGTKHTMRAVGVLCLQLYGAGDTAELQDEIDKIATVDLEALRWDQAPGGSLYGWYYATQSMFHKGGKHWKSWNNSFQNELKNNQSSEGYWDWPASDQSSHTGPLKSELNIRVYATTLCSLMLTVYYRYLPMTAGTQQKGESLSRCTPTVYH